jgi:hypothetical protein
MAQKNPELANLTDDQLYMLANKLTQKPKIIRTYISRIPDWVSVFACAGFICCLLFQLSDFNTFLQRHRDEYMEAISFKNHADYEVCMRWPILASACTHIRIITIQHYILPAMQAYFQSKYIYQLGTSLGETLTNSWFQIGAGCVCAILLIIWFANRKQNQFLNAAARVIQSQHQ